MGTPVTNFGKVTVSTTYDAVATSIVLTTGHGSRLPSTFPYPLTWWNATDNADPADDGNKEIVIVTNRSGDTLTITRAGEGTSASTKNTGGKVYKMVLGLTKAMWDSLFTNSLSQSFRGLHLRTHPDSDKALAQVQLVHADAIVMNDGQEIKSWDLLTADLTVSGAGGIDTGTELASTWYEIYAIYNPVTTTKKILAHRAKDYLLDQDATAGEDATVKLRDATARTKIANGFKVATAGLVEFVDVRLIGVGAPTGNYWCTIETDSGTVPSGTVLATSDKYDASRLQTPTGQMVRLPFRVPAALSAATQYHLVLQGDFTVSATNHIGWREDSTASAYANGQREVYDGTTWTGTATSDLCFKIYVTRNDVALTLPSGYTQYALIGYAYNNGSSNLKHFWQKDRTCWTGYDPDWLAVIQGASLALISTFAFTPPINVVVTFLYFNTGVAGSSFGQFDSLDASAPGTAVVGTTWTVASAGYAITVGPFLMSQYQGFILAVNASTASVYVSAFTF